MTTFMAELLKAPLAANSLSMEDYRSGLQPSFSFVAGNPGALPQADIERAFSAYWKPASSGTPAFSARNRGATRLLMAALIALECSPPWNMQRTPSYAAPSPETRDADCSAVLRQ